MLTKDCDIGMMVIATPEANSEYGVTVEGVIGVIDNIDDYELDDDDGVIDTIHIRPTGIQTSEEILNLMKCAGSEWASYSDSVDPFFDEGYWVSPKYFEPYYEGPKIMVSLSDYIM